MSDPRPFAIVTGASTGIGFELAKRCVKEGYDLLIAADEPEIEKAAASLRDGGTEIEALQADLATTEGVDCLYAAVKGRQVDALLANAGRGLGHGFLDQDFEKARRVVDTNITGTVYLIHRIGCWTPHKFGLMPPRLDSAPSMSGSRDLGPCPPKRDGASRATL
jgi:uncharacterized protein